MAVGGACGGGGGKSSTTTLLGSGDEIGAGLITTTTGAPVTTAAPVTTSPKARCQYTDPVSEIEYQKRIRLTLTVSALCPSPPRTSR